MNEQEQVLDRREILKAVARGYVQGVGFRVFIRSRAWDLGLRGYVKNMPDGTVKVVAEGLRSKLDSLLAEIWRGPAGAHVKSVDTDWTQDEVGDLPSNFEVRH